MLMSFRFMWGRKVAAGKESPLFLPFVLHCYQRGNCKLTYKLILLERKVLLFGEEKERAGVRRRGLKRESTPARQPSVLILLLFSCCVAID